jgi:hypothetical protein
MGWHSKLEIHQPHIKGTHFSNFEGLEDVVRGVLSFFEFGCYCSKYFIEYVVEESKSELVFKVNDTIFPNTIQLADQDIVT